MDSSFESKDMSFVDMFVLFAGVDMASLVLFTDMTLLVLLVNVPLSVALADKTLVVPHVSVLCEAVMLISSESIFIGRTYFAFIYKNRITSYFD